MKYLQICFRNFRITLLRYVRHQIIFPCLVCILSLYLNFHVEFTFVFLLMSYRKREVPSVKDNSSSHRKEVHSCREIPSCNQRGRLKPQYIKMTRISTMFNSHLLIYRSPFMQRQAFMGYKRSPFMQRNSFMTNSKRSPFAQRLNFMG